MDAPIINDDLQPINPMIAAALGRGEDATGLCTVRECVEAILDHGQRECDMAFQVGVNTYLVRVQILQVDIGWDVPEFLRSRRNP